MGTIVIWTQRDIQWKMFIPLARQKQRQLKEEISFSELGISKSLWGRGNILTDFEVCPGFNNTSMRTKDHLGLKLSVKMEIMGESTSQ